MINKVKHGVDCRNRKITEATSHRPGVFLNEELALQTIAEHFRDDRIHLTVNPITISSVKGWTINLWVVIDDRGEM